MIEQERYYSNRIERFGGEISVYKRKINRIFQIRLLLFLITITGFIYLLEEHTEQAFVLVAIIVVVFLLLLKYELKLKRKLLFTKSLIVVNEQEINLINQRYNKQDQGEEFIDNAHSFVADLDIFGQKSLFQLLNRTSTYSGRQNLAYWLSHPIALKDALNARQEAIKVLAKKPEWCQAFVAIGLSTKEENFGTDFLKEWLQESNLFSGKGLKLITTLFPLITLSALVFSLLNVVPTTVFSSLFVLQLMLVMYYTKAINETHNRLSRRFDALNKYIGFIDHIEGEDFEGELLQGLKAKIVHADMKASTTIGLLKKQLDALDARMNIIVAVVLNGLFLWDIRTMFKIEKWRSDYKQDCLKWIDTIGVVDAFVSLGMYSYSNKNYTFPNLVDNEAFTLKMEEVGHPMIAKDTLVSNTYAVCGTPHVDLLTGANMAGKSTFLRTVGVNLVLAMVGAPVCAKSFHFTPILLFTSLRTNDSLQENESFFYAELKRLKQLIRYFKNGENVFFLLDEILKGTNSKDQHLGAQALIKKIIKHDGTGIIATHDVELSKLIEQYPEAITNLCFEISIDKDKLHFDYTLKEGVCRTMNASYLLKKMEITD